MSNMKCPFCQQELSYADTIDGGFEIFTCDCKQGIWFFGNDKLWQALIDTKKKLAICEGALNSIVDYGKIACSELQKNALGQFQKPISKMQDIAHLAVKQINQKEEK